MKEIGEILKSINTLQVKGPSMGKKVTGICYDSRRCGRGMAFVALTGASVDGHDFIESAIKKGATAIVAERDTAFAGVKIPNGVTVVIVPDSRIALAMLSDYFYDQPSEKLDVIGVTGTNGKTTVAYLVQAILEAGQISCGRIGTTGYDLLGASYPAINTTPESLDLQQMFNELLGRGGRAAVVEVSSHALAQHRVESVKFSVGVYTNLTQDHLDYHKDMDEYFSAKAKLFSDHKPNVSVVNIDDSYSARLLPLIDGNIMTYGLEGFADVTAEDVAVGIDGIEMTLKTPLGSAIISSSLTGRYNVYNILAAAAATIANGSDILDVVRGVASLGAVPGRFEIIDEGQPFTVVVDYAHTDDALTNVLKTARALCKGSLITLFGCGGDRDADKRPKMGKAAWSLSDKVVVTSDNPRTESPEKIIADILEGINQVGGGSRVLKVVDDRRAAIRTAIDLAAPGDIVVIAGKGHEDYQIIGTKKNHFDDREEAREAIKNRGLVE